MGSATSSRSTIAHARLSGDNATLATLTTEGVLTLARTANLSAIVTLEAHNISLNHSVGSTVGSSVATGRITDVQWWSPTAVLVGTSSGCIALIDTANLPRRGTQRSSGGAGGAAGGDSTAAADDDDERGGDDDVELGTVL